MSWQQLFTALKQEHSFSLSLSVSLSLCRCIRMQRHCRIVSLIGFSAQCYLISQLESSVCSIVQCLHGSFCQHKECNRTDNHAVLENCLALQACEMFCLTKEGEFMWWKRVMSRPSLICVLGRPGLDFPLFNSSKCFLGLFFTGNSV